MQTARLIVKTMQIIVWLLIFISFPANIYATVSEVLLSAWLDAMRNVFPAVFLGSTEMHF